MAFIRRIMNNRQDLISFIQRAGGYSLTGDVSERIFFVLWGTGKNGKSTLLEILSDVLGDYARTTPPETLMVKPDGAIPHDVARLAGALFVSSSEGEESKRLGVAFIKRATGNERMTARELFCPIFEFAPEFKIWFATNHKPVIKDTTESIWDRVKLIPLDVRIPEHERDPRLRKKLQCELPGILAWLVAGCLDWQKHGIGEPEAIQKATAGYRAEMDTAGTFIEENCILGTENMIPAKQLQAAYAEWCAARGKEYRPSDLASKLKEVGCESKRKSKAFFWLGIGIVDPDALEPDEPSPAENDPMIPNDPKFEDLAHEGQNDEKNPENEIIEDQGSYAAETEGRHYEF
jgi:putative DNA primase/helicase